MIEKRNIFISFPFEEQKYMKDKIVNKLYGKNLVVDYSEKIDRRHTTDEYIWQNLLTRIKGSSITIVIHDKSLTGYGGKAEYDSLSYNKSDRFHNSGWVYKEIVASLRDWEGNRINGIIYLIPDNLWQSVVISDWNGNEKIISSSIPKIILANIENNKFFSKDGYILIVKESIFLSNPEFFIEKAYEKRRRQIENKEYEIKNNLHLD